MQQAPLIDQAFLEKLERLTLHWQKSFPGLVGGRNPSRFSGSGQEFLDHRNFHHGDDLRAINWRAYMRLEKLFLKMFQVEPRIPVRLLLDTSRSMSTGEGSAEKFQFARKLAAAMCFVGLVRLDTITIQPFREGLLDALTCGGGRHRFVPVVNFLRGLEVSGRTNYMQSVREFAGAYPQRGLVIVISDFLDQEDAEKPLQYLADFGHEMMLLQLWAPEDREPPWDGQFDLTDAETGEHMEMDLDPQARADYTTSFDAYSRRLQIVAQRNGGRYVGLSTDTVLEDAIFGTIMPSGGLE
jgi:uncharacterized protein (DUF58 family)